MLGINARVEDLREQIIRDINRAQMPACILDYILTEILNDVRVQRMSEVQKERERHQAETRPKESTERRVDVGLPAPGEAPMKRVKAPVKKDEAPVSEEAPVKKAVKEEGADDNNNPDS